MVLVAVVVIVLAVVVAVVAVDVVITSCGAVERPTVVRALCAFHILTSTCASRHNGMHFFNITTSKTVRTCGVFSVLTSKCFSRQNSLQFFPQ